MMNLLHATIIGLIGFTVIYIILKYIEENHAMIMANQSNNTAMNHIDVKIVSKDLYIKADIITRQMDIYSSQAYMINEQIDLINEKIQTERCQGIATNNNYVNDLILQALNLEDTKCKLETKIFKLNEELEKIGIEELRRQRLRER